MVLKSLEMQGFKSFPDKTTLEFGKGITAVIGPNGSGKSNISDAVRWVLGEQSTKSLRGSRMEDVVFGGTGIRKAQGFAEVSLCLDNSDFSLNNCDKPEVSVSRRYYRSGESEYLLNGENVRLRDIHELFMDTGLGRDGYSLVGQGRIAELVSSKSSQRRDMLEEAAGISHFRYRRADATRKLDQAEENLVRLRDILSELEGRIGPLKVQSDKANKFISLAGEKKNLEIGLWIDTVKKSREALKSREHKLSIATAQYEQVEIKLTGLAENIEEKIEENRLLTAKIEEIRQQSSELEEKATAIDGLIAVENNTILHNKETIERITRDMEAAASTGSHINEQISAAQAEIDEALALIGQKKELLLSLEKEGSDLRENDMAALRALSQINERKTAAVSELSERKIEETTACSSIEEIHTRLGVIDNVLETRGGALEELNSQRAECASELERCKETIKETENSLSGYSMLLQSRAAKAEKAKKESDSISLELHQKSSRIKMLEDLEKNMEGYSGSVKAVVREAKRGLLRGIRGPVSQLINVESKYAVAVETALGASIQHVVTNSEEDAKKAIGFLKESNAGRATFLPMTSIKSRPFSEKGLEDCVGFIDMADRLLTYDREYAGIIESLLARTAVVDNLDNAVHIAKRFSYRFKIVTLDGQVINAGGSMTGGSRGHSAGFLSRSNEIEALRKTVSALQKRLDEQQESYKALASELSAAQAQLDGAQADLARSQENSIRTESRLSLLDGRIETAVSALTDLEAEKKTADSRLELLNASLEKARAEAAAVSSAIAKIDLELEEAENEQKRLLGIKDELSEKSAAANLDILALQKDIEAKKEIIEALSRRRSSHSGKIDDLNEEIAEIAKKSLEIKEKIAAMEEEAAALRKSGSETREDTAVLIQKRGEAEAQSTALRAEERSLSSDKEKLSGELARLEERLQLTQKEIDDAQNKLFDEYQLTLREAEALGIDLGDIAQAKRTLHEVKSKIRALGNVNVDAIEEYKEVSERFEFLNGQISDIEQARAELLKLIGELTEKMSQRFREQFVKINTTFGETFSQLFDGGKAELSLENPHDVLESAIEIKVQPPGKNVQNIDLLSGGEKGLSAIALLFAILQVTPAPFCIFDEVEAALDDVNVLRYAKYVRRMTDNTQFILITHRRGTMEEADVLYGVTMQEEGVSKLLELKTAEMVKKLGIT